MSPRPDEDAIGRLLAEAFDARARTGVSDEAVPPPPRFAADSETSQTSGASQTSETVRALTVAGPAAARSAATPTRWLAPLLAAAAVLAVVASTVALLNLGSDRRAASAASGSAATTAVHIRLQQADDVRVGVGMPVIAYFSKAITDARALARATTVRVNDRSATAAWYFERSAAHPGYPVEGHLRLRDFWPAHAAVTVAIHAHGLGAGPGLRFDNNLTLRFSTGASSVATVDDVTHKLTLVRDGKRVGVYPVSLGARRTPTMRGTKVVMQKMGKPLCLTGPGYRECGVRFAQRLTYGGEFLHAAPWNVRNIDRGVNTSNGCTNMRPADAAKAYAALEVGDIVRYPNAGGPQMALGNGYGDWNVPWKQWLTGGYVRTR